MSDRGGYCGCGRWIKDAGMCICDPEEQPVCPECGCDVTRLDEVEGCYDHLPDGEEMYDYAKKKAECLDKITTEKDNWRKAAIHNAKESEELRGVVEALKAESQGRLECILKQGSVINALKSANEELIALNNKIIAER